MSQTAASIDKKAALSGQADNLLTEIRKAKKEFAAVREESQKRVAAIAEEYGGRINTLDGRIGDLEKALYTLARKNKKALFHDGDKLDLAHGILIRELKKRVKHARCVLENLKALGQKDAVRIAESVDWDRLEKWTDEDLERVGTQRVEEERFQYELKPEPKP